MSKFLELLAHPDEALAVLKFKLSGGDRVASSSSASSSVRTNEEKKKPTPP